MSRQTTIARAAGLVVQAVLLGSLLFLILARLAAVLGDDVGFRYQGF